MTREQQDADVEMVKRVAARYEPVTLTIPDPWPDWPMSDFTWDAAFLRGRYKRRVTDRMLANSPLALSAALNLAAGTEGLGE